MNPVKFCIATLFVLLFTANYALAEIETRYGLGVYGATSYSPDSDISWLQGTWVGIWDYDSVWPYSVPEDLAFKVEVQAGSTVRDEMRLLASVNMYATYYIRAFETERFSPYFDAGIGLIYTDFQAEGQGLRFNFNPQLGIGTEITTESGTTWFTGFRLHHISNAGLDDENTGVNSVAILVGKYF